MSHNIPYVAAYGNITKALQSIQKAQTPERFTQDFLATKLGLSSSSARPVIPFLKKTGFLSTDGTPTEIYKRFRNSSHSGVAAAEALRKGFVPLFEINEYAYELSDTELKGIVVQATGLEESSSTTGSIIGSFKALKAFANFDARWQGEAELENDKESIALPEASAAPMSHGLRLGYTINLNLPATSDIAVYNAIFKSLREHLLG